METSRRKFLQLAAAVAGLGVLRPKALLAGSATTPNKERDSEEWAQYPEGSFQAIIEERLCMPMVWTLEAPLRAWKNREIVAAICFPEAFMLESIHIPSGSASSFELTLEHTSRGVTQKSFTVNGLQINGPGWPILLSNRFEKGDTLNAYFTHTAPGKGRNNRAVIYLLGFRELQHG